MNRLFLGILILPLLFLAAAPSLNVAAESRDFDLNGCYASCPCSRGLMDHACAVCKQQCEWQNWRQQIQKSKKKEQ